MNDQLTEQIIGAAIEVHRILGLGCSKRCLKELCVSSYTYAALHMSTRYILMFIIKVT